MIIPYHFCTRCGTGNLSAVNAQEYVCPACNFRHFINPISAVVGILSDANDQVLLIRRGRDPGRGLLGLPGGFVDVGETAEQALSREIEEEVGLQVNRFQYFVSLPNRYPFQGLDTPVLDFFFTAKIPSFDSALARDEVASLEPVSLSALDLDQVAFPSNRDALRLFAKEAMASGG